MFRSLIFILTLIILGISVTISTLNTGIVDLDFYIELYSKLLPFFLFISFLVGCLLTLLFFLSAYIKHKHENITLRKTMKITQDEIDSLRKNPLRDDH